MRRAPLLVALATALAACGPGTPAVRLRAEPGRDLRYDGTYREDMPHPVAGLGGVAEGAVRFRLKCLRAQPDGGGVWETEVESLRFESPAKLGLHLDTEAAAASGKDALGARDLALSLLRRPAEVTIDALGITSGYEPDARMRDEMKAWARGRPPNAMLAVSKLDEILNPAPQLGRWLHVVAMVLPRDPHPDPGASWTAAPPRVPSPAGDLRTSLAVTYTREGDTAVLHGRGSFEPDPASTAPAVFDFDSGSIDVTARLDLARGVLAASDEHTHFVFRLRGEGRKTTELDVMRTLRLVE